jgi:hypothetical protein
MINSSTVKHQPGAIPEEVKTMAVVLAPAWPRPRVLGEHITVTSIMVPLIQATADDLRLLQERTKLSTTDLTNRAITSYEFFDAHLRVGHDLIVRDNRTGET